jgi:uncharacterized protein YuzE
MPFIIQRDRTHDQLYIALSKKALRRGAVAKTVRATDDIFLDFDSGGKLVGIDVSNASKVLGRNGARGARTTDELVGVAEAARLFGVKKPNFLRDYVSRKDFPKPAASLASGRIWLRSEIEAYRNSEKRIRVRQLGAA